jgi:hypothetical protein
MKLSTGSLVADPAIAEVHSVDNDHPADSRAAKMADSVYRRITTIIGVHPNRSELTAIVNTLGWVPLGRSEKRVKGLLIQKLETARDKILPMLETAQGTKALEDAYLSVVGRKPPDASSALGEWVPPALPPEATVEFYLNRPNNGNKSERMGFGGWRGVGTRTD